jgi:myo-inositol 2-dehydrogenase / D-chiro-inositol 1-dehydrogenase
VSRSLGVGFLGAGLVTQAIHLPVLAAVPEQFHIVSVMDIDAAVAAQVAARCGATSSTDADAVVRDPHVDVVVVCSPNALHAAQVIAACQAGKRAVLCEKPLALSHTEAEQIRAAAAASGTNVVVGAMHAYDPGYRAALAAWLELGDESVLTQSIIYLPSNDIFTDQSVEPASSFPPPPTGSRLSDAVMLRDAALGLVIHNVPLLRQFHPRLGRVVSASFIRPFGYAMVVTDGIRTLELFGYMGGSWPPHWQFRAVGRKSDLSIAFPPSFVLAGSSRVELRAADSTTVFEFDTNGYQQEWASLYDAAVGEAAPLIPLDDVVDDVVYALDLADQVDPPGTKAS